MKRILTLTCCLFALLLPPAHAQPKNAARKAVSAGQKAASSVSRQLPRAARAGALPAAAARAEQALRKAAVHKTPSPEKRQKMAAALLAPGVQPKTAFLKLRQYQRKYGAQDFFERFSSLYYARYFGDLTPDMQAFLHRMNAYPPAAQQELLERLQTLAANRRNYLKYGWPERENHILRLKYLPGTSSLTDGEAFLPQSLVYAYEIQAEPGDFLPLGPGKEISVFNLEGTDWYIAGFSAGLAFLPELYRFLVTDGRYGARINVTWDKPGKSLLVSSADGRVQVRVSPHEYGRAGRLHLHVNRQLTVHFQDAGGARRAEQTALNFSFPVYEQAGDERTPLRDWFITRPAQKFLKDPNAEVRLGKIF